MKNYSLRPAVDGRGWLVLAAALICCLLPPSIAGAEEDEAGHMHGPDGRHIAVAETFGAAAGKSILSHHDLRITDTGKFSLANEGAVVEGADVHSIIHKKGDPSAVVHREHNAYEAEIGVYGSHMVYKEPGEYVIVENITLPGGKKYSLEFPIWVPGPPSGAAPAASVPPVLLGVIGAAALVLVIAAFVLGRRSGRRAAAGLLILALAAALTPSAAARAQDEEAGHMHGPDGRHVAVAETFGSEPGQPLRAFLGPNGEIEAFQTADNYRFRLSIENAELEPPDPEVVTLPSAAADAIGLQVVTATSQPLAGGLSTTGQVRPNPNGEVTVNSRVSGRILRMNVTPGQAIGRGRIVAVIDSTEVAEAQAALSRAQAEQRQAEAARGRAAADVRRMQAQVAEARADQDRTVAQRAEAEAEVERARADLEVARGKMESARKTLARQQQLAAAGAFAQAPVEIARAAVAEAEGELQQAETSLANREAQARRLEQGVETGVVARRDLEAAQAAAAQGRTRVSTAGRQLQIARAALAREERIQRENLRDAREVQTAQADLEAAQFGVTSAEAGLARQQKGVEAAEARMAAQRRTVQSAEAQVDAERSAAREADAAAAGARQAVRSALNRLQLLGARPGGGNQIGIGAPIGGHVHSRPVNAGQAVSAGEPIAVIVNTDSVWVESNVFEKDLPRIRVGQRISIASDAIPGRTFDGSISYISHDVDPATRAVQVRTVVPNPNELLKPNMFVRVVIASGQGNAVTVPQDALQEQGGEQVVFVAEGGESYRRKAVRVGPVLGDLVVIESGLKAGERVVTQGSYQLLARVRK